MKGDHYCYYCNALATKLCDGRTTNGTCDRPMCDQCVAKQNMFIACSRERGKKRRGYVDTIDYCRECHERRKAGVFVKPDIEKLIAKTHTKPKENKMQLDLIPRTKTRLTSGVVHLPDWLPLQHQNDLLTLLRHWTKGQWYTPLMLSGTPLGHPLACLGYRWKPYEYFDAAVPMPGELILLGVQALVDTGLKEFLPYQPQTAIVNYFPHGSSLGMHQDRSEHPDVIAAGSPIVTISLGDSAIFRLGNSQNKGLPWQDIEVRSGDVLVMGGYSRSAYHGVMEILPDTAPPELQMQKAGRISVTLRQVRPGGC